jgi:polyisoprenoid-binding protein YceI
VELSSSGRWESLDILPSVVANVVASTPRYRVSRAGREYPCYKEKWTVKQVGNRRWRGALLGFALLLAGGLMIEAGIGQLTPETLAQDDISTLREVGVIASPDESLTAALADCAGVAGLAPGELAVVEDGQTSYVISGESSETRYVVEEELATIGANTAIGRTNAFIGQILLDSDSMPASCSRFDVDMRTLVSDSSRRDNYLRGATLQSDQYPIATFILRAVEGLAALLTNEEQTFTLIGDLVFRGQSQLVAWEASAALDGDALIGSAFLEFGVTDFTIEKPVVGSVVSIDDTVRLEVDIVAQQA